MSRRKRREKKAEPPKGEKKAEPSKPAPRRRPLWKRPVLIVTLVFLLGFAAFAAYLELSSGPGVPITFENDSGLTLRTVQIDYEGGPTVADSVASGRRLIVRSSSPHSGPMSLTVKLNPKGARSGEPSASTRFHLYPPRRWVRVQFIRVSDDPGAEVHEFRTTYGPSLSFRQVLDDLKNGTNPFVHRGPTSTVTTLRTRSAAPR